MPEITIHDIAKKLNISASTVSRALNNSPLIKLKTALLIKKTAEEMGYHPNLQASNFRTKKTNTIGVIVPLINRYFFSTVISGIEEIAYKNGYTVTISQSNDNYGKEVRIAQTYFSNRIDGLIVSIGMETTNFDHFKLFPEKKIPLVFFDRVVEDINTHKIVIDDFGSAYKVTRHLLEQGAKTIVHIGGPLNLDIYKNRRSGYLKALQDHGIKINEDLIIHNNLTKEKGIQAIEELLNKNHHFDGVFCANDTSALGVIIHLKNKGFAVPNDVLVMGFSNEPFSEVVTPSISTIVQPAFKMGCIAAEHLLEQIQQKDNNISYDRVVLPTELIIRESTTRKKYHLHDELSGLKQ